MKNLDNTSLLAETQLLVSAERKVTLKLIQYLAEIERRRIYAELAYSSMWEFCIRYLKLSEGAAQRRLQAARLIDKVPAAVAALESGQLSLSNAAKIQTFSQAEKKQGREVDGAKMVEAMHSLSQRACEQKLFEFQPESVQLSSQQMIHRERQRIVSQGGDLELKFVISAATYKKLERLKEFVAHSHPHASLSELLDMALEVTLLKIEKQKGLRPKIKASRLAAEENIANLPTEVALSSQNRFRPLVGSSSAPSSMDSAKGALFNITSTQNTISAAVQKPGLKQSPRESNEKRLPPGKRVYLPVELRQAVWAKSGGQCEYVAKNGKRCGSHYKLEIDHQKPLALMGENSLQNLRLLCRGHQTFAAIQILGEKVMRPYLSTG